MAGSLGGYMIPGPTPLGAGSVVSGDLGAATVFSGNIASGQLGWPLIGNGGIVSGNIGSGQVFTLHIASGGLLSGTISSGSLSSFNIASGGFGSGAIGSGQISLNHLSSGAAIGQLNQLGTALGSRTVLDGTANNSGAIVTTSGPGVYRVSIYSEVTQGGLLNAGNLGVAINWTSDSQVQTLSPIAGVALITSGAFGQSSSVVRAVSGTAIGMSVTLGAVTGAPHYNAFGVVERVQ